MRTFAPRLDAPKLTTSRSPLPLFSLQRVKAQGASSKDSHPTGTGISARPFARSQRRFRHHCEVKVPGLRLRFHAEAIRGSVRFSQLLRSVRFRGRSGAISTPEPVIRSVLPRPRSGSGLHSPSGPFRDHPDPSVQPSHLGKFCRAGDPFAPGCPNARFIPPGLSFRKPWN